MDTVKSLANVRNLEHVIAAAAVIYGVKNTVLDEEWRADALKTVFSTVKAIPGVQGAVDAERNKALDAIVQFVEKSCYAPGVPKFTKLPEKGLNYKETMEVVSAMKLNEQQFTDGKAFGGIYHGWESKDNAALDAYALYEHSNALWPTVFPGVKKFEAEVVRMTLDFMNGDENSAGTLTSGGTESLVMAVKTYWELGKKRGVKHPECILPASAHPGFDKGCHYLGVKIRTLPVGADWKADVSKLKSMINKNTIFIAGSAPGFPHGVIDDIPAMAAIALEHKVPFHVDMCLGGFLLPFLKKLGHIKDSFDFKVPGVTSISADAHKYGGCPKGNSVIMYNSKKLRQLQFFAAVNWSGGLYCSPSFQGSRPGGLIAGCYAHMINTGMDGYLKHADNLNTAFVKCVTAIQGIEGLEVMGEPAACIIGVNSSTFNILQWADVMDDKGWDITRLQKPSCIHIPIGTRQIPVLDDFIADMKDATRIVKSNPEEMPEEGMAQIYGMAGSVPDRGTITDLLFDYMDILLTV